MEVGHHKNHSDPATIIANLEEDIDHYILKINELESYIMNRDLELDGLKRVLSR